MRDLDKAYLEGVHQCKSGFDVSSCESLLSKYGPENVFALGEELKRIGGLMADRAIRDCVTVQSRNVVKLPKAHQVYTRTMI